MIAENGMLINEVSKEKNEGERKSSELKDRLSFALKNFNETSMMKNEYAKNDIEYNSAIASLSARKKMLEDLINEGDGFSNAVKKVIDAKKANHLKSDFVGVLANLIKVDEKFNTAIEMALGGAIQNIVTKSEKEASDIIGYLKENKLGRATFLPVSSAKPRTLNPNQKALLSGAGIYDIASNLISYSPEIKPVIEGLLGGTVIVENLPTAVKLAKDSGYTFKIVSLEGDIINPSGSMTGGSKRGNASSLLGRENELKEVIVHLEKMTRENEENAKKLVEMSSKLINLENEIKGINIEAGEVKIKLATSIEKYENLAALNKSNDDKLKLVSSELLTSDDRKILLNSAINALKNEKLKDDLVSGVNENFEERQKRYAKLKSMKDEYSESRTNNQIQTASLNSEILALKNDLNRLNAFIEENEAKYEESILALEKVEKTLATLNTSMQALNSNKEYLLVKNKLEETNNELDAQELRKKELQENLKVLETSKLTLNNKINKLNDRKFSEEMQLAKIDADIENMQERIWNAYELTYGNCLEYKVEDYDHENGFIEAGKLSKEIERLGYVNVNAIEESIALEERYNMLTTESTDIKNAISDLNKIIKELSQEMHVRFENAFRLINESFDKIFKELFGGGNAKLVLIDNDDEDVLEKGVEIIAEPPGKKLKDISLSALSGGEQALTAICILFSILKLRPMPFCLLDEIEAALDDANVFRFAKYLNRFSSETQFIVITHRKPTMELADNLYGVTMQEKGVSNIVSVNLSDVDYAEAK